MGLNSQNMDKTAFLLKDKQTKASSHKKGFLCDLCVFAVNKGFSCRS